MELSQLLETYRDFLKQDKKVESLEGKSKIESIIEMDKYLPSSSSFIMLLDMKEQNILFVSDNFRKVTGHEITSFYELGLPFYTGKIYPDDLKIWGQVLQNLMNYTVQNIAVKNHKDLSYSYNYRFKHANGKYINILENQISTDFDELGRPTVSVGHFSLQPEISSSIMRSSISQLDSYGTYKEIYTKSYITSNKYSVLTSSELNILKLISSGKSTSDISEFLCRSRKTIENHRANICEKLGLKQKNNSLLSYALQNKNEIIEL